MTLIFVIGWDCVFIGCARLLQMVSIIKNRIRLAKLNAMAMVNTNMTLNDFERQSNLNITNGGNNEHGHLAETTNYCPVHGKYEECQLKDD